MPVPYSPEEALSFLVENDLSKGQYINIRKGTKQRNDTIYPSYHAVREAKLACHPSEEDITVTDISAEVKLQPLLDLTVNRLVSVQEEVISRVDNNETITIIHKCGCDGSSGHRQYKTSF